MVAAREQRLSSHIDSFKLILQSLFSAVPPSFLLTALAKTPLNLYHSKPASQDDGSSQNLADALSWIWVSGDGEASF
jgi:hypothetical protein